MTCLSTIFKGERTKILQKLTSLKTENKKLQDEFEKCKEFDPEVLKVTKKESNEILEAANRWTDNLFSIRSWCNKKFNIDTKHIDKQFGIPDDFDYIEE